MQDLGRGKEEQEQADGGLSKGFPKFLPGESHPFSPSGRIGERDGSGRHPGGGRSAFSGAGFLLLGLFSLVATGCGGGGGGAAGGGGSAEIVYVLSQSGSITEVAINKSTGYYIDGSFANSSTSITVGPNPIQLLFSPNGSYAYVLNNGNNTPVFAGGILTASGSNAGSVQVFSVGPTGLSTTPTPPTQTGESPVSMAIDSAGGYLVVADHGNGTTTGDGDVEVFPVSGGSLSTPSVSSSPCNYPNKVLFPPGSNGTSSENLYILCSSPEASPSSSSPTPEIYYGPISSLNAPTDSITGFGTGASPVNLAVDPSGHSLVAPLLSPNIFITSNPPPKNPGTISATPLSFIPAGQMGFAGSSVLLGSYNSSSNSNNSEFESCPLSGATCSQTYTTGTYSYPIAMDTNPAGTALYIPLTGSAVVANGSNTNLGTVLSLSPTPPFNSLGPAQPTGVWPLSVSFDPAGNFAFIPNYGSKNVSVYSVGSGGALSFLYNIPVGPYPVSVTVR